MADTFAKKELQKKRAKKKEDKAQKREERKSNNTKGKSLEDMIVYLDEYGNFTDIPPDKQIKRKTNAGELLTGTPKREDEQQKLFKGTVSSFMSDKGYGFITEDKTRGSIFVHSNALSESISSNDRVSFEKEKTLKGYNAVNVKKIN
ncbi:cold-shock protein [Polluticaenibacter yanchengensis]|uniref:Cold shock domain-containing protein n=1 Tax=Polluticaenibacter yanchengensis TaxID=3014562 RepID=A0ABT4UH14_9BACT|nr:cold shock domain-containing protein [Chitinophagaceae bacterium LY-5]